MPREKDTYLNREGLEYYHRKIKGEFATKTELNNGLAQKQDNLTSANAGDGIEITRDQNGKVTISNTNVSAEWGNIQGDITQQTDLVNYINQNGGKIDKIKVNGTEQQIVNKTVNISVPTSTSDLTNNGEDGTSKFATEAYVDQNGGKIDKIKVNNVEQPITNKTVNITVPTKTSDLTNDSGYITTSAVNTLLETKQNVLTPGNGIDITNDVISLKSLIINCGTSTTVLT